MFPSFRKISVLILVATFLFPFLAGQVTTGSFSGTARDESGAVLPGATITITHLDTSTVRTVFTDDQGRYSAPQLPLGDYEIQAELVGFQTEVRRGVKLTVGRSAIVDFSLPVGQITDRIVVTGEASLVETTTANLGGLVDDQKIRALPLNGRDIVQLAFLQEGVVGPTQINNTQGGNTGVKLSISGTRSNQTAFLLDGTDIRNNLGNTPTGAAGILMGVDTIREFKVITSVYSAEYGRFTGGVISMVSKSGTNSLHGSVFEFHRNSALDARNFFDRDPSNPGTRSDVPAFKRNQFGFTIEGPIQTDKTFFLGSYEGFRERLTQTVIARVPNDAARLGDLPSGPVTVDPDVQDFLELYPRANGSDLGGGIAEFIHPANTPINEDYFTVKVDHHFGPNSTLSGRYTFDDSDREADQTIPIMVQFITQRNQYLTLSEKHVFGPSLVNEVRFGFNRSRHFQFAREVVDVDPKFHYVPLPDRVVGLTVVGGATTLGNILRRDFIPNTFEYSDDLVYTRGPHSLKFGVIATRFQSNQVNGVRTDGIFVFTSLQNLLVNSAIRFDAIISPVARVGIRQWLIGFYGQDDYKIRPDLTLNLGLRYAFVTNPTEVGGRLANMANLLDPDLRVGNPMLDRNPSLKNFAPRVGFAWDVFGTGNTALRGGMGIFYDQYTPAFYQGLATVNPPFFVRVSQFRPAFPDALAQNPNPNKAVWVSGRVNQPYIMQYSLSLQQSLGGATVVQVGYQGSRGIKLSRIVDANQVNGEILPDGRTFFDCAPPTARNPCPTQPLRNPNFGQIRFTFYDSNSFYNSLKLSVNRRFSDGLQFQASYNFAKMIDDASQSDFNDGNTGGQGFHTDPDNRKRDRGLSIFDIRHAFSVNFAYDLPFGRGRNVGANVSGFLDHLISGWQINAILSASTGPRGNPNINFDRARNGQFEVNHRPNLVAGADNNPVLNDGREPTAYFDTSAFELQEAGFFGDLARNTLEGPGIAQVDLGVVKNFSLSEQVQVQFRTEMFNLFNRANFTMPSTTVFTGADRVTDEGIVSPTAGTITRTTTTSRQIQFALKILF